MANVALLVEVLGMQVLVVILEMDDVEGKGIADGIGEEICQFEFIILGFLLFAEDLLQKKLEPGFDQRSVLSDNDGDILYADYPSQHFRFLTFIKILLTASLKKRLLHAKRQADQRNDLPQ